MNNLFEQQGFFRSIYKVFYNFVGGKHEFDCRVVTIVFKQGQYAFFVQKPKYLISAACIEFVFIAKIEQIKVIHASLSFSISYLLSVHKILIHSKQIVFIDDVSQKTVFKMFDFRRMNQHGSKRR